MTPGGAIDGIERRGRARPARIGVGLILASDAREQVNRQRAAVRRRHEVAIVAHRARLAQLRRQYCVHVPIGHDARVFVPILPAPELRHICENFVRERRRQGVHALDAIGGISHAEPVVDVKLGANCGRRQRAGSAAQKYS